jgi:hypothetical protein
MDEDEQPSKPVKLWRVGRWLLVLVAVLVVLAGWVAWKGPSTALRWAVRTYDPALRLEVRSSFYRDGEWVLQGVVLSLRGSHEPVFERQNGLVSLRQPSLRVACSYLVTVWIASGEVGEAAILKQHQLLAEVLRVFAGLPTIPPALLSGTPLASQPYPITLVSLQSELMRNPAEFWSALGGKLRPSFTLTATIALDALTTPVSAKSVNSTTFTIEDTTSGAEVTWHQIGGTVRSAGNRTPVSQVAVSIEALGLRTLTDADGRFLFGELDAGTAEIKFAKVGYTTVTRSMQVPGATPTAFDVVLSPVP